MFELTGIRVRSVLLAACCAGLLALVAMSATPCRAASIPAWLDENISRWNAEHAEVPIRFVNIKDSYVWYDAPKTAEIGQKRIREALTRIVLGNGYVPMDEEELVTTGKPPVVSGPVTPKKCWKWSYVLNIESQSNTKAEGDDFAGQRQRMLTTMVCEDTASWWMAFRVLQ
ncbi:MAG TPA: hypothetical protein VF139_05975 [Candidatus Polarisedimenticolaceae bacterium]